MWKALRRSVREKECMGILGWWSLCYEVLGGEACKGVGSTKGECKGRGGVCELRKGIIWWWRASRNLGARDRSCGEALRQGYAKDR